MSNQDKAMQMIDTIIGKYETLGRIPEDWYDVLSEARKLLGDSLDIPKPPAIGVSVSDEVKATVRFG